MFKDLRLNMTCNLGVVAIVLSISFLSAPLAPAEARVVQVSDSRANSASAMLKRSLDLRRSSTVNLTALLMNEKFAQLEDLSNKFETLFLSDPVYEESLLDLYLNIDGSNEALLTKLDKWVETRPSYMSYAARGSYKVNRGSSIRGTGTAGETPQKSMEQMHGWNREAKRDLLASLKLNKKFLPPYNSLIHEEMTSGHHDNIENLFKIMVKEIPNTYYVRLKYVQSLAPKWGGTYKAMQAYVDTINTEALSNPRIWSVKAEVAVDQAESAWRNEDYQSAINLYTKALTYGDRTSILKNRGKIYLANHQPDLALRDFMKFSVYDKTDDEVNQFITNLKRQSNE